MDLCGDWVGIDHRTGDCYQRDKDTQAALIVEPGGKLIAEGTKDAPIVFTSEQPKGQRKPGDWGD